MASLVMKATMAVPAMAYSAPVRASSAGAELRTKVPSKPASLTATSRPSSWMAASTAAADIGAMFDETEVPTPDVPSPGMMADFLVMYGRILRHFAASGDAAASAGEGVLERVRVGLLDLLRRPHSAEWEQDEQQLELCLVELKKDLSIIERYHARVPPRSALQMASLRCAEAARLLQRL